MSELAQRLAAVANEGAAELETLRAALRRALDEVNRLRAELAAPKLDGACPRFADPFQYVVQHVNSLPYDVLAKDEIICFVKKLRDSYSAHTGRKW